MSGLVGFYEIAAAHREVAISILDAELTYGKAKDFAAGLGITEVWLSNLRDRREFRFPSIDLAKRIASHLSAPAYVKQIYVDTVAAGIEAYERARGEILIRDYFDLPIDDHVLEINESFRSAVFAKNWENARRMYQRTYDLLLLALRNMSPNRHPFEFLMFCTLTVHVTSAMNLTPIGLFWIQIGKYLQTHLDISSLPKTKHGLDRNDVLYFLLRDEGLAYHNIGLAKKAIESYEHAKWITHGTPNEAMWKGDLARNTILALVKSRHFTEKSVTRLYWDSQSDFERRGDSLSILLNQEALARALISLGTRLSMRKAETLLRDIVPNLVNHPSSGPLHRAIIQKTTADFYLKSGEIEVWESLISEAITIMIDAGLLHQLSSTMAYFGDSLTRVLNDRGIIVDAALPPRPLEPFGVPMP